MGTTISIPDKAVALTQKHCDELVGHAVNFIFETFSSTVSTVEVDVNSGWAIRREERCCERSPSFHIHSDKVYVSGRCTYNYKHCFALNDCQCCVSDKKMEVAGVVESLICVHRVQECVGICGTYWNHYYDMTLTIKHDNDTQVYTWSLDLEPFYHTIPLDVCLSRAYTID